MNQMLELNIKIVKKLRSEVNADKEILNKIDNDDMLWVDQLSRQGRITPVRIIR